MPELRQNIITREWVIIAKERAKRLHQLASERKKPAPIPSYVADCPFCVGNEHLTLKETYRVSTMQGWKVRVVENKYPALSTEGEKIRTINGIYRSMSGVGFHEVIIEHPRHDLDIALFSVDHLTDVLMTYRQRYVAMKKDPRIEAIIIFKNHGEAAGTSIRHPHAQLAAMPIVPAQIRQRIEESIRYFDETGDCIFCRTLKQELVARERIVFETQHFVAFIPYAALSPFHLWIFPRRHTSSFDAVFDLEMADLALNLKTVLARLHYGLNDPDYNFSIRSIPARDGHTDYFHWYFAIIPRITRTAGFEIGSGMYINTAVPEESASFLRAVQVPD
jgi:UDPglucose--hexose-1-phosphate uridylyltransferase